MKTLVIGLLLSGLTLRAAPTEQREWTSSAGTKVTATANSFSNGVVTLETADGRKIGLTLDKFAEEDRNFLIEHFGVPKPGEPRGSGVGLITGDLPHPLATASGPVDAGGGSNYFVYLPKTLREGRKAPLMLYTGAGGGNARTVSNFSEAAELNGWIIAASVESKNGDGHPEKNHEHAKRCVEHLLANLPIDEGRVYFSGNSGGGAMSFYNALRIKSMGNMPFVGYSPDKKYDKKQYCIGIGGTNDFNRYLTAHAVEQYGDKGFHRMAPGGHSNGPAWLQNEGITWLNGRFLGDRRNDAGLDPERLDFEFSMIRWIDGLRSTAPHRAHYWCHFLQNEYRISGPNAEAVRIRIEELSKDTNHVRYTQGVYAINGFSEKYYVPEGEGGGSKMKHTTPKIRSAAEKLAAEYAGVPEIEETLRKMGEPT
ncbi:MAG TPA: hypothetical protein VLO11_00800 [Luteolibacter sp.]|nr:hypothetical protein [Luteolibacter sp.]